MSIKKRIEEFDFLKGLAMIMVVVAHTKCPVHLHNMFYLVHVPIFFIVSGCTSRSDEAYESIDKVKKFIIKRIKTLYIPYLKYALPIILLHNVFFQFGLYEHSYTLENYAFQILRTLFFSIGTTEPFLGQLWFIKTLFLAEIYYAVLVYISFKSNINKWIFLFPLLFVSVLLPYKYFPHFMQTNLLWPFKAIFLYLIGQILVKKFNYTEIKFHPLIYISIFILWIISPFFVITSFQECSGILSIAMICFSIGISFLLIQFYRILKKINVKIVRLSILKIGSGTMSIYCLHYLIFGIFHKGYLALSTINFNSSYDPIHWSIYAIAGICIPLIVDKFIFSKVTIRKNHG